MDNMKCSECVKENKKSCVYVGVGSVTAMYFAPYYDEKGEFHHHDGNTHSTSYSCSNGHHWTESRRGSPCHCGWGTNVIE